MNIGMFITPTHTVPPDDQSIAAPWSVVSELTEVLVKRGNHQISLFAPTGSKTSAKLYDFRIPPTIRLKASLSKDAFEQKEVDVEAAFFHHMMRVGREQKISVFHLHQANRMYPLIAKAPKEYSFLITLHDPMVSSRRAAVMELSEFPNCFFVSVSNAQRGEVQANFIQTIYHGIPIEDFPFQEQRTVGFSVFGRIIPVKGQSDAIEAANKMNVPLTIVGETAENTEENKAYWESIAPQIDGMHMYHVPFIQRKNLSFYYQRTKAILMPIKWEEPFGLVMIEAMASGTPVIAYNRGSVPEIVVDGVTGFIIDPDDENRPGKGTWIIKKQGIDGLVEAMGRIDEINRLACRKHVEDHFTAETMATGYEQVYEKILNERSI